MDAPFASSFLPKCVRPARMLHDKLQATGFLLPPGGLLPCIGGIHTAPKPSTQMLISASRRSVGIVGVVATVAVGIAVSTGVAIAIGIAVAVGVAIVTSGPITV